MSFNWNFHNFVDKCIILCLYSWYSIQASGFCVGLSISSAIFSHKLSHITIISFWIKAAIIFHLINSIWMVLGQADFIVSPRKGLNGHLKIPTHYRIFTPTSALRSLQDNFIRPHWYFKNVIWTSVCGRRIQRTVYFVSFLLMKDKCKDSIWR